MSFNIERLIAYGLDALSYYFIPHWSLNYGARKLAAANLKSAIADKCGADGATNEADLQKQLADATKGGAIDVFRFPAIPKLGWRIPFLAVPNYVTNYSGVFLANMPGLKNLSPIKNGTYAKALSDVSGNIQCKNGGPPSGGNPVQDPSEVSQTLPAPNSETGTLPAANMVSSATMAGIPVTDLSSQLSQVYGTGSPSKTTISNPGAAKVNGHVVTIPVLPIIPQAPVTLPAVKPVPVLRPIPVAP
jgi:hypothetical protein